MSQHLLCKSRIYSIVSYYLNIPGRLRLVLGCVLMKKQRRLCPIQPQSSPRACSWSAGVGRAHHPTGPLEHVDGEEWLEGSWSPGLHAWVCVGILSQNTTARKRMGWHTFSDGYSTHRTQLEVCCLVAEQRLSPTGLSFLSGTSCYEHA